MKLFKKLMSAMLAGVLAVGMLAGCSGGSVNGPVPTSPRPEDPAVQAVYEVIEQKTAKMNFVSAPAYSKEASALAEAYLNGGDKTKAFNELKAALAQQGLRISNAQDTAEASSLSKFSGPDAVWTSDLEETNYSLNKRYTDTMIAGLVDYRCNSVGIAVKDGKMSTCALPRSLLKTADLSIFAFLISSPSAAPCRAFPPAGRCRVFDGALYCKKYTTLYRMYYPAARAQK